MLQPTALALSRHFTTLTNRQVQFKTTSTTTDKRKAAKVYGIYSVQPSNKSLVLMADLVVFGSIAGAMLGLPDEEVTQRLRSTPLDDWLDDAMREAFDIATGVIAFERHAVLEAVLFDANELSPAMQLVLKQPKHCSCFTVEISQYSGGYFAIVE